jgi:hypothetical protein
MKSMCPVLSADDGDHVAQTPFLGLSTLLRRAFSGEDVSLLGPGLIERVQRDNDAYAMLDLSTVLQLHYQREAGLSVLDEAVRAQPLYRVQQSDAPAALRVLALKSPGDLMCNTPFECILDGYRDLSIDVLYVRPGTPWPETVPDHDLLLMAVGEADAHLPLLAELEDVLAQWPRPVLNRPGQVPRLARDTASRLFAALPGLCMASTARTTRDALQAVAAGQPLETLLPQAVFPLIVRPLGAHAGSDLARVDDRAQLAAYLETHAQERYYVAQFIDYGSPDGLFRKYRVAVIDGEPHLCHMGLSQHWMVHYPYEEMLTHATRRDEEAAAMAGFASGFAQRHRAAVAAMQQVLGLDYWGMDCAETRDGRLLVFEVTNAMIIHAMDRIDAFPYKQAQMRSVFDAFHRMLERRARPGS